MTELINTPAHRAARNAASIALADTGAGHASVHIYDAPGGTLLGVRRLAKPCATVRPDGPLVLVPDTENDLVLATGNAAWAEWVDGSGTAISAGHVTDEDGNYSTGSGIEPHPDGIGPFVLSGAAGTTLYAGGLVLLTDTLIG